MTGDPVEPRTFFMGSVDGGVWKTVDAGTTWRNITDGNSTIASVGAIAVAPSDHNVIYVGTGETDFREDLTFGDGMYRSTDGGKSWKHIGLEQTRQIATVRVDPKNPGQRVRRRVRPRLRSELRARRVPLHRWRHDVEARALRRRQHGRDRPRDGSDQSAHSVRVDVALSALSVGLQRRRRQKWTVEEHRWRRHVDGAHATIRDMPDVPIGRIGVSVSGAMPNRVYAYVETSPDDSLGGIYRSENSGASWARVNGDQEFMVRPWYYSLITADPQNPNVVYNLNLSTYKSIDGGTTFKRLNVPHGDDHAAVDRSARFESHDRRQRRRRDDLAGWWRDWSSQDTQPPRSSITCTRMTVPVSPLRRAAGQLRACASRAAPMTARSRDRTGMRFPAASPGTSRVNAKNPDIVVRRDRTSARSSASTSRRTSLRDISVGLPNYDGYAAKDMPLRFQWTFPMLTSPHERVHDCTRRRNASSAPRTRVNSWQAASPDLTLHDPATLGHVGGPITHDETGTEVYATIFALRRIASEGRRALDGLRRRARARVAGQRCDVENVTPALRRKVHAREHHRAKPLQCAERRTWRRTAISRMTSTRISIARRTSERAGRRISAGIPRHRVHAHDSRGSREARPALRRNRDRRVRLASTMAHAGNRCSSICRAARRAISIVHGTISPSRRTGARFWVLDNLSPLRQIIGCDSARAGALFTPDTAIRWDGGRARRSAPPGRTRRPV